jgi:PIN like domain
MKGLPEAVFFTDRDLGRQFPEALQAAGLQVERHDQHFAADTPDSVWIPEVARRGWIALTRDKRIRYSPLALRVLKSSDARLFVLVGKLSTRDAIDVFLRHLDAISNHIDRERPPFIAKIRRDGIVRWLGKAAGGPQ